MERHFAALGRRRARDRCPAAGPLARRARRVPRASPAAARSSRTSTAAVARCALGAGPVPRGALRRGPAARPRADRGRLRQGLPSRGRASCTRTTTRPRDFLRRYFDEFRSLREVLDHVEPAGPLRTPYAIRGLVRADQRWLTAQGVHGRALVRPLAVSARHHTIRMAGRDRRQPRRPPAAQRCAAALSLEGRDNFVPVRRAGQPAAAAARRQRPARQARPAPIPLGLGVHPPPLPAQRRWRSSRITAAATGPDRGVGRPAVEGRLRRAHDDLPARSASWSCAATAARSTSSTRSARTAHRRTSCARRSASTSCRSRPRSSCGLDDFDSAPTSRSRPSWWTAFAVRDLPRLPREGLPRPGRRAPVLRDLGRSRSGPRRPTAWATAASPTRRGWPSILERDATGCEARWFECGTDLDTYPVRRRGGEREPGLIAVYARRETERRAVDLAMAGLAALVERRPGDARRALRLERHAPARRSPCRGPRRRARRAELAELYRRGERRASSSRSPPTRSSRRR